MTIFGRSGDGYGGNILLSAWWVAFSGSAASVDSPAPEDLQTRAGQLRVAAQWHPSWLHPGQELPETGCASAGALQTVVRQMAPPLTSRPSSRVLCTQRHPQLSPRDKYLIVFCSYCFVSEAWMAARPPVSRWDLLSSHCNLLARTLSTFAVQLCRYQSTTH